MGERSKGAKWIAIVMGLSGLGAITFMVAPIVSALLTPKQDQVAREVMAAIEKGDPGPVLRYAIESERSAFNLDAAKTKALLDWSRQNLSSFRTFWISNAELSPDEELFFLEKMLRNAAGEEISITVCSENTPDGPRVYALSFLITSTLLAKYQHRYKGQPDLARWWGAKRDGFREDGPILEAMGFPGIVNQADGKLLTWKQMAATGDRIYLAKSVPTMARVTSATAGP